MSIEGQPCPRNWVVQTENKLWISVKKQGEQENSYKGKQGRLINILELKQKLGSQMLAYAVGPIKRLMEVTFLL